MFIEYTYTIARHYLPALINGDPSGLTDQESADLEQFEAQVIHDDADGAAGHWSYDDSDADNFKRCAVSGLDADCVTVTYNARGAEQ